MTKIQYQKCLSEIFDKVNGKLDIDWSEIKEKYNIPYTADTIRKASTTLFGSVCVAEFLKFQQQENDDKFIQTEFLKDGNMGSNRIIHLNDDELNDKNSLLKAHGFDPQKFELVSARNTIWTSTNKNKMYSSRMKIILLHNWCKKIKSAEYWVKFVSSHSHIGKVERRGVKSRVAPGNSATSP